MNLQQVQWMSTARCPGTTQATKIPPGKALLLTFITHSDRGSNSCKQISVLTTSAESWASTNILFLPFPCLGSRQRNKKYKTGHKQCVGNVQIQWPCDKGGESNTDNVPCPSDLRHQRHTYVLERFYNKNVGSYLRNMLRST